jgi:hypothetical protein
MGRTVGVAVVVVVLIVALEEQGRKGRVEGTVVTSARPPALVVVVEVFPLRELLPLQKMAEMEATE